MRNRKFRMWDGYGFIYFWLHTLTSDYGDWDQCGFVFDWNKSRVELNEDFVNDYTWFTDLNGQEIFEYDIIDYVNINGSITQGIVIFEKWEFLVMQFWAEWMKDSLRMQSHHLTVVNNVYELSEKERSVVNKKI